eukprot:CAMPEP_0171223236 /NCGR_PEP_ID=MMETSP0790-20130122/35673_1 /TAXON_ID=2925 /ORGANISM="Alexandrium catenella, Strain OF101" /LENGTH=454 /DNA_ID=CAMNT_0011689203 /DNA_START=58 /DNA_END=1422 /DNA_ORIENTATION=+
MVKSLTIAATMAAAPCLAFVPQANLRAQPLSEAAIAGVQAAPETLSQGRAAGTGMPALAALGLATAGLASGAAARAARKPAKAGPGVACRAVGVCLPLTEKWDPLDLGCTDSKMDRYTAVEIKHGRTAMIACIGYVMPEVFRFPGCESFESGLAAFDSLPAEGWIQLFAFIGAHEVLVKPRSDGMGSFDLGLGTELLDGIDDEELERRQTVERNNGRLAMVAIMGLLVQDSMFGKNPIAMLATDGWWGPSVDMFIQDIPICAGTAFCAEAPTGSSTALRAEEQKMSPAVPFLNYPEVLDGWVGGEKGFDPLNVTDALPVYLVREAELKHGRVCMLATLGWIATDLGVRFPGDQFQNVSTVEAHNAMVSAGVMGPFLATIAAYEVYGGWLCLEGFEGKINREAGDFFLGKNFLPKDEAQASTMKLKELENGRLAMLAFSGICTQSVLTGEMWPFF